MSRKRLRESIDTVRALVDDKKQHFSDGEYLSVMDALKVLFDEVGDDKEEKEEALQREVAAEILREVVRGLEGSMNHHDDADMYKVEDYLAIEENIANVDLSLYDLDHVKEELTKLSHKVAECMGRENKEAIAYHIYCLIIKVEREHPEKNIPFANASFRGLMLKKLDEFHTEDHLVWAAPMKTIVEDLSKKREGGM